MQQYSQFTDCLGEMAVEGDGDDVLTYTRTWFDLVNFDRGGLYPLNDDTFLLFEKRVCSLLPEYMLKSSSDKETFRKTVHDKVFHNVDVRFIGHCCLKPRRCRISLDRNYKLVGHYQGLFYCCFMDGN